MKGVSSVPWLQSNQGSARRSATLRRLGGYLTGHRAAVAGGVLASLISAAAAAGYAYLIGPLL
jgi:hypothetical protein